MSRLTDLIAKVESIDPGLARDLSNQIGTLTRRRSFGLNFEQHVPETVELYGRTIRRGDKVRVLPERGKNLTKKGQKDLSAEWRVTRIKFIKKVRFAALISDETGEAIELPTESLIVIADFRDPIYPGLKSTGKVERGGDKPFHAVINAENFHALEALMFPYEGKVDAIYIDPPYNTLDKSWKYNNNYVDSDDAYKHSKWLSFIERRLKLAKKLLNPNNSVLIFTIDEKEYLRAGLLLEQVFSGCKIQMVSSVINPKGVARGQEFYRVDEYIFIVFIGSASVRKTIDPMILTGEKQMDKNTSKAESVKKVRWGNLLRSGTDARRIDRKWQFYPIFLDAASGTLHSVGEPLVPVTSDRSKVISPDGTIAIWPIRKDGSEGRWQVGFGTLRDLFSRGYASVGKFHGTDRVSFSYVTENVQSQIEIGGIEVVERDKSNAVVLQYAESAVVTSNPKTIWNKTSHSASEYGTTLLRGFIPGRQFPFPKSLYAVEDALRFFVSDKPDALVVDFFGGSGTTTHAVARLNRQDNGRRRSIVVTNNEVSDEESKRLIKEGFRQGDPKWEAFGICEYITKPRIKAAFTGLTPEGLPVEGKYRFIDEFFANEGFNENVEFFDLTYEDPDHINRNMAFEAISPLLWMRAGSEGKRIDKPTDNYDLAETYGILFNLDSVGTFVQDINETERDREKTGQSGPFRIAYIVAPDEGQFQSVSKGLPEHIESVHLYESFLSTFEINAGKE